MSGRTRGTTWGLFLCLALLACEPDKYEETDTGPGPSPEPEPEPVAEVFDADVDGVSPGGVIDGCEYRFDVDALPDGASDVTIDVCTLVFDLSADLDPRSDLTLKAPGGAPLALPATPTTADSSVSVDAFLGTERVDGRWTFESSNRGDCSRINGVRLRLAGEYLP